MTLSEQIRQRVHAQLGNTTDDANRIIDAICRTVGEVIEERLAVAQKQAIRKAREEGPILFT